MLVSSFVFVISIYSLFYYFRYVCRSILRYEFEKDYSTSVVTANNLEFLEVRRALEQGLAEGTYGPIVETLERDFQTLTYLLRNAATVHVGRYSRQERLLIIDYHLLRLWFSLKRLLHLPNLRGTLVEMTDILSYFANVMGHRAATFATANLTY